MAYISPRVFEKKFTCPHCGAIAHMLWEARGKDFGYYDNQEIAVIRVATCSHCDKYSLWNEDRMVFPEIGNAPPPNSDLPASVTRVYEEAARISSKSPRGAAALLRLAVQIFCKELGEKGKNINEDIASLVRKGLPERVQQSLDIVRVTGNEAVHPGQIDTDSEEVVGNLFMLLNVMAEYMISLPQRIGDMYDQLPQGARDQIEKRDS